MALKFFLMWVNLLKASVVKKVSVACLLPSFLPFQQFMFSCPLGGSTGSCGPGQRRPPWRSSWQVWRCMILTEMPTEVSALASLTKRGIGQSNPETKHSIKLEHHNRERTGTPKPTTAMLPPSRIINNSRNQNSTSHLTFLQCLNLSWNACSYTVRVRQSSGLTAS